jgi:hypothetical protein
MLNRPEELALWLEYFDGKEVYRMKTSLRPDLMFQDGPDARREVGYVAENMFHRLEKDLFDRA